MKYSQLIGILVCLALFGNFFLPWVHIASLDLTLNGFNGTINEKLSFGKQAISHGFFLAVMVVLFSIKKIWAKRTNMYVALLNLAWAIKNYLLFSTCRPECPQKQAGIYLLVVLSGLILIMTLLPKMEVPSKKATN